ncbi:ATP-dependent DNA helicase [Operophtera brumata]|uniref:ATP-dependent DNA helicase n=1 Tax=Operophtera brumata TaxID=104452 RepID=A0A0L7LKH3_OPEBR|nr:ATP-dependent DNA helicase [Operophtera brumata]
MSIVSTILIFNIIVGSLGAWQPDIDINRVRLLTNGKSHHRHSSKNPHSRRSILQHQFRNDNDYHSSGLDKLRPPMHYVSAPSSTTPKALKVYQPREDPRVFYQSDTYAKEVNENSLNNEVTAIYPGNDVVRAGEDYNYRRPYPARLRETNDVPYDHVMLQHPHLTSCNGHRMPREMLRYCYMSVDVLIQTCALPKYLIADCRDENKTCSFTCRDHRAKLHGPSTLSCGDDMKWVGQLPACSGKHSEWIGASRGRHLPYQMCTRLEIEHATRSYVPQRRLVTGIRLHEKKYLM